MRLVKKTWQTFVPGTIDEVWHFFSRPENLDRISPENMSFKILSDIKDVAMYQGMLIEYTVAPILRIPMYWVTEITYIKDKTYFIDEQRIGPYAIWHHEHHFVEAEGGVEMTDILYYKVGYGPFGAIANKLFVERQVEGIFDYRENVIHSIFGQKA